MRDDTSIDDILQQIRSERAKERAEGLAELRRTLTQGRQSASLDTLSDKAYHKILETLFGVAQIDSSSYAVASKPTTKSNLRSRLSSCAGVIRFIVESGLRKLRFKTVKAVLDHVTQTLPKADDGYCEPLLIDYFKILRSVLEYPPHAEHLPKLDWVGLIDFCIQCVQDLNTASQEHATNQDVLQNHSRHISRSSTPNSSLQTSRQRSQNLRFNHLRPAAEDVLDCLRHLCGTPNAPISDRKPGLDRTSPLIRNLVDYLELSVNAGTSQKAAFEALLHVLHHVSISDVAMASQTYRRLLSIIGRLWQSKSSSFRDLLSIHLLGSISFVQNSLYMSGSEDLTLEVLEILTICRAEYCKRPEREQLQIDDLEFSSGEMYFINQRPLSTKHFAVRYGAVKAEQPWALLYTHAAFVAALDSASSGGKSDPPNSPGTHPRKRQRLDNPLEDLSSLLISTQKNERLYAAQVIAMVLDLHELESARLNELLESLLTGLGDSSGPVVSWTMLALTS